MQNKHNLIFTKKKIIVKKLIARNDTDDVFPIFHVELHKHVRSVIILKKKLIISLYILQNRGQCSLFITLTLMFVKRF